MTQQASEVDVMRRCRQRGEPQGPGPVEPEVSLNHPFSRHLFSNFLRD